MNRFLHTAAVHKEVADNWVADNLAADNLVADNLVAGELAVPTVRRMINKNAFHHHFCFRI